MYIGTHIHPYTYQKARWKFKKKILTEHIQLKGLAQAIALGVAGYANVLANADSCDVLKDEGLIWDDDSFLRIIVKIIIL